MLRIPTVRTSIVIRKRRLEAFESHVGAAHDGLPHVIETVDHVPMVIIWDLVTGCQARVCLDDSELLLLVISYTATLT